jgi:hypothetical protein
MPVSIRRALAAIVSIRNLRVILFYQKLHRDIARGVVRIIPCLLIYICGRIPTGIRAKLMCAELCSFEVASSFLFWVIWYITQSEYYTFVTDFRTGIPLSLGCYFLEELVIPLQIGLTLN